jgi:hypothetical protein
MDEEYAWLTPEEAANLIILKPGQTQDTPIRFPPPRPVEEQSGFERWWRDQDRQRRTNQAAFDEAVGKVADMIRAERAAAGPGTPSSSPTERETAGGADGADGAASPAAPPVTPATAGAGDATASAGSDRARLSFGTVPSPWSPDGEPLSLTARLGLIDRPPVAQAPAPAGPAPAPTQPLSFNFDAMAGGATSPESVRLSAPMAGTPVPSGSPMLAGGPGSDPMTGPPSADCDRLAKARDMAMLATHTYGGDAPLPQGYAQVTDESELKRLGLSTSALEHEDGHRAQVFKRTDTDTPQYVLAFRGTASTDDWAVNATQATGLHSDRYKWAQDIGRNIARSADGPVEFTGHSLGGGLASAAAVATGRQATTFNAAGLHTNTVKERSPQPPDIAAYYVQGDPLSYVQDHRGPLLSAAMGAVAAGAPELAPFVAAAAAKNGNDNHQMLPQAEGTRRPIPNDSTSWFYDPLDGHSMSRMDSGIAKERQRFGCTVPTS